jgi:beta-glucanase (GH16 family)
VKFASPGRSRKRLILRNPPLVIVVAAIGLVTSLTGCDMNTTGSPAATQATSGGTTAAALPPLPTNQSWTVDFSGPAGSVPEARLLTPAPGGNGAGNNEVESYTPGTANASLDGAGNLAITARKQTYTGSDGYTRQWTSARLTSDTKWSFTYGTLTARIQTPVGQGLWPAFWLLGTNQAKVGWPKTGEVDILESLDQGTTVFQSLHGPKALDLPWAITKTAARSSASATGYHVYGVTKSFDSITFTIDGAVTATLTPHDLKNGEQWVFNEPMFLILNLAVGGNWPGDPNSTTPAVARMLVDWIKFVPPAGPIAPASGTPSASSGS